jgi:p-aminobenzoyl-glutamate transporter AbgT
MSLLPSVLEVLTVVLAIAAVCLLPLASVLSAEVCAVPLAAIVLRTFAQSGAVFLVYRILSSLVVLTSAKLGVYAALIFEKSQSMSRNSRLWSIQNVEVFIVSLVATLVPPEVLALLYSSTSSLAP